MSSIKKYEEKEQRTKAKAKAQKLQMSEFLYAGALGAAEGFAEARGMTIVKDGLGPLKFEYLQLLGGGYLAMKKTGKERELGSALTVIALYKIGKNIGGGLDLGGFLGGG